MNQIEIKKVPREVCLEILRKRANTLGLSIEIEWKKKSNTRYVCFHISGPKSGHSNKWFCFSIILTVPELKLGVWTRRSMKYHKDPLETAEADRIFEPTSFDQWLETWFENTALKELAGP